MDRFRVGLTNHANFAAGIYHYIAAWQN